MTIQRVANIERAQMLIECTSRKTLPHVIAHWQADSHAMRRVHRQVIRGAVDVDLLAI
jgi:primosomal protein N' (replication factor Y) (superfamily II helicase)